MPDEVQVGRVFERDGGRYWVAEPPPIEFEFDSLIPPLDSLAYYHLFSLGVRRPSAINVLSAI